MKYQFSNPQAVETESGEGAREFLNDGKYHLECVGVQVKEDGERPSVRLSLEVRNGTDATQKNKTHLEYLPLTVHQNEYVQKRNEAHVALFSRILGAAPNDLKERVAKGEDIDMDWDKAIGKHVVCQFVTRTDKNDKAKVYKGQIAENCIYAVDDPRVADVPKDDAAIQRSQAAEVF